MGSINPHIAQNSPGALCEKWAIADFDVRTWLPQKLEPKKGRIHKNVYPAPITFPTSYLRLMVTLSIWPVNLLLSAS